MPHPYPHEFRERAIDLIRAGEQVGQSDHERGINAGYPHTWLTRERIGRGEVAGTAAAE